MEQNKRKRREEYLRQLASEGGWQEEYKTGWQQEYRRKLVSAEEAVKVVKSGDRVCIPLPIIPVVLPEALAARRDELKNVETYLEGPLRPMPWFEPGWEDTFPITFGIFVGAGGRAVTDEKRADYLPFPFPAHFKRWDEGVPGPIDVLIVSVSPPDENGYCSFGSGLWNKRQYAKRAKNIVAEVSELNIRTGGDNYIHVSDIDYFVEHTPPLMPDEEIPQSVEKVHPELRDEYEMILRTMDPAARWGLDVAIPPLPLESGRRVMRFLLPTPGDADKAIAENASKLINHGDTIQMGVGVPSRFLTELGAFDDKMDLGLHTELSFPGLGRLVKEGVITGKYKNLHTRKAVATAFLGVGWDDSKYIDNNPTFELYDAEYVVDIRTFAAHENMVAINNAISIDLSGQINSETAFGGRIINGPGGQPEAHIGAFISSKGRAITLVHSTALEGAVSTIVATFEPGDVVTIPRHFADYVVTEYGIASLFGKPIRRRAEELIAIAHPDFRGELRKQAKKLFWP